MIIALEKEDIFEIEKELWVDGKLVVKPYSYFRSISENKLKLFMVKYGVYVIPTMELMYWLRSHIRLPAIEIGSGNGSIGRTLGIPMTDNRLQEKADIKLCYETLGQAPVKYGADVQTFDAIDAIKHFKPQTVVASFMTHKHNGTNGNYYGPDEFEIMRLVNKYIMIGNKKVHEHHGLLKEAHSEYYFDWLITRGEDQNLNRIFVFQ